MGDELGGLSTSLGLLASPPLILSTESVVVMEWKGVSTSTAAPTEVRLGAAHVVVAIAVLMPFHSMTTTDLNESISERLARGPSKVHNPPSSSPIHAVLRQ